MDEACDGRDARAAILRECPSLLIAGCNMPNMSGNELAEQLAGDERLCSIPAIVISALKQPPMPANAIVFLANSFKREQLEAAVRDRLATSETTRRGLGEQAINEAHMRLSQFITESSERIIAEWEVFARSCLPAANAMDLEQRRDHVAGMLKAISKDLETPQSNREQREKAIGNDDADVDSNTASTAHGSERAASGYTPVQMVSEFRALRASVLRLWAEAQSDFDRANLEEITRFNEAIDQLLAESMTKYAQEVDRFKDVFLGVLGHDLRNPLGAIMMSATVLATQEGPEWQHSKTAARILSSGTRMEVLIGDLLDFTRARLGAGIPITCAEVDLEAECRKTVDEIAAFHPACDVSFHATGDLRGRWDGVRIAQALSNLLGNAVQHGTQHGPIAVTLRGEADRVVLSVHNEGRPIPKRHLHDIFDPFRQLDPGHAKSNVGLGLYIVQAIVAAHGGTVDAESSDNGATFTIRLPRVAKPAA